MLLGHNDKYSLDTGMQITIAFNHFGEQLVQRMPRCRRGYIHVVNNDFTAWEMYAIGGSANPTINSQGNRYTAPIDNNAKEVKKKYPNLQILVSKVEIFMREKVVVGDRELIVMLMCVCVGR